MRFTDSPRLQQVHQAGTLWTTVSGQKSTKQRNRQTIWQQMSEACSYCHDFCLQFWCPPALEGNLVQATVLLGHAEIAKQIFYPQRYSSNDCCLHGSSMAIYLSQRFDHLTKLPSKRYISRMMTLSDLAHALSDKAHTFAIGWYSRSRIQCPI